MAVNIYQVIVFGFAVLVVAVSAGAVVVVAKTPNLRFKPLWIIGSLLGFVGLGIEWTKPDDIILLFGVSIPVVMVFKVIATGQVIVKTGFPVVAIIALVKALSIEKE
jgi:hypothetical protein